LYYAHATDANVVQMAQLWQWVRYLGKEGEGRGNS